MTNALTLCATRNNLASNIWMGPSQHGLQTDASCRVRCSWNQNRKRGPTGSRTAPTVLPATHARLGWCHHAAYSELECSAHKGRGLKESTPESKRTNILKFGRRNWRQPRPTPTPCRRQWCPIFRAPFSTARPLPGCISDQRPRATQSNRPQWQTDGKRTQNTWTDCRHGSIMRWIATRHKSRGRGAPSRRERIGLSRAPERKRKLKRQKRTDLCTQTAAKLSAYKQPTIARRSSNDWSVKKRLALITNRSAFIHYVLCSCRSRQYTSEFITGHASYGERKNECGLDTAALQAQRQKEEAGRDKNKSHAASLALPRFSGNRT